MILACFFAVFSTRFLLLPGINFAVCVYVRTIFFRTLFSVEDDINYVIRLGLLSHVPPS